MKAGKRTSEEIKLFLDASYQNNPPETIGDWILDKSISNKTGKVYYNPKTKEAVVAHRGTEGALDWINNIAYVTGTYKHTNRYKRGKNLQNKAEAKYGKENISTLAHSQGAVLARDLGADTKEVINVNPAYLGEETADNEYNIKSSSDIVSGLYPEREGKDIIIPSENPLDIVGEHSYNILDRLDDNELIGQGLKSHHYNIMTFGGRRCQELGYSVDDIDWINGGVRDIGKALRRGMRGVNKELSKANPLGYKGVQNVGAKMGDITNNYLLPAVVSAGKPMLDVTAMGASTMLTGNPVLGKAVSDIAWREGVQKTGNDPRERQKNKTLGELSGVAGQTGSKFLGFGRKKKGGSKKPSADDDFDEELSEIFGRIKVEDERERPKGPIPKAPKATGKRKEAEAEAEAEDAMDIDEEPEEPRRKVKVKRGKGRKMKGGNRLEEAEGISQRYYDFEWNSRNQRQGEELYRITLVALNQILTNLYREIGLERNKERKSILENQYFQIEEIIQDIEEDWGSEGAVSSDDVESVSSEEEGAGRKMKGGVTDPTIPTKPSKNPTIGEIMSNLNRTWQGIRERENQAEYNAFVSYLNEQLRNIRDARLRQEMTDFRNNIHDAWEHDRNPESSDTSGDEEHPRQRRRVGNGRTKKGGVRTSAEKKEARRMGKEDRPPLAHATPLVEGYPELEAVDARPFEAHANFFADEMDAIEERYFTEQIPLRDALRYSRALSGRLSRQRNNLIPEDYDNLMRDSRNQITMFELILSRQPRVEQQGPAEEEGSVSCVASGRRSKKGGKYPRV